MKGLDIGLGAGRTVPLPAGTTRDTVAGVPTVLADGSVTIPLSVAGGVNSPGESLDLLWLRPNGHVDVYPVDRDPTGFFDSFSVVPHKAIPNGRGGVLVAYDRHYTFAFFYNEARVRLVNADGSFGGGSSWGGTTTTGSWLPGGHGAGTFVLGEHGFRATGYRYGTQGAAVRVSDITLEGYATTDFYIQGNAQPRFATLADGEFFASYADGTTSGPDPGLEAVQLANAISLGNGSFIGSADGAIAMRTGRDVEIANTEWPEPGGGQQSPNSSSDPEFVITVNVFIPEQWVDSPIPGAQCEAQVFGGDDRGFSRTGSSRIHQEVRVARFTSAQNIKIGKVAAVDSRESPPMNNMAKVVVSLWISFALVFVPRGMRVTMPEF